MTNPPITPAELSLIENRAAVYSPLDNCGCYRCQIAVDIPRLVDDLRRLQKENRILALKTRLVDRLPFCPDHRDKVAGKPCRECAIERLRKFAEDQPCDCLDRNGDTRPEPCDRCKMHYGCETWGAIEAQRNERKP